ncbi:MAG: glycosyltransferase domain-containing protein [Nanoarchaeota archaeon]
MRKIAVITSIFGNGTKLFDPATVFENTDYFAFVDKEHDCKVWKQIKSPSFSMDQKYQGRRDAKIYKIMPHLFLPEYDVYIWTDPTHELIKNPHDVCDEYLKEHDIALFYHTTRKCAYKEAAEIIKLNYDHIDLVENQVKYYSDSGFPERHGLFELPVSIRKNCESINAMNLRWWEQICKFSSRDQISLPFVLWSMNIRPNILPGLANGGLHKNEILPQVRWKWQQ